MKDNKKTSLTDTEWMIMSLLWDEAPLTCRQIEDSLKDETGWTRQTVISFLKRMMKKNYIRMAETSPARLYYPILDRNNTLLKETRSFAKKAFDGEIGLLVSSLVDSEDITEEEINSMLQSLEETLNKKEK